MSKNFVESPYIWENPFCCSLISHNISPFFENLFTFWQNKMLHVHLCLPCPSPPIKVSK